ncbi:hypothetical protein LXL04_002557 [Taraxacum kok-saghyz]
MISTITQEIYTEKRKEQDISKANCVKEFIGKNSSEDGLLNVGFLFIHLKWIFLKSLWMRLGNLDVRLSKSLDFLGGVAVVVHEVKSISPIFFDTMKLLGLKPNMVTYNALINGFQLDRITYNFLLAVCTGGGLWETAMNLFHEMSYKGIDVLDCITKFT